MQCICGKTLDVNDCDIGTCQGCGEYLMPEDIAKLEKELGIKKEAPEVEPPKLVPEGGIKVPEMMECKNCGYPLYADHLKTYLNGGNCPICKTPDPDAVVEPTPEDLLHNETESEVVEVSESSSQSQSISTPEDGILVRLCTGPLVGNGVTFLLPTGKIIGREFFKNIIEQHIDENNADCLDEDTMDMKWYAKSLTKISREHFKISEDGTIEDMGSSNGTFLDREEIFAIGGAFELGMVLSIADEIMLTRVYTSEEAPGISITHFSSGLSIDVPAETKFHLGRLREDGRREPFAFAIEDQMSRMDGMDHDDLRRISRRHAHVWADQELRLSVENIDGKEVEIIDWNGNKTILNDEKTTITLDTSDGKAGMLTIGKMVYTITRNS